MKFVFSTHFILFISQKLIFIIGTSQETCAKQERIHLPLVSPLVVNTKQRYKKQTEHLHTCTSIFKFAKPLLQIVSNFCTLDFRNQPYSINFTQQAFCVYFFTMSFTTNQICLVGYSQLLKKNTEYEIYTCTRPLTLLYS